MLDDVRRTYISLGGAMRRVAIAEELVGLLTRARDAAHARFQAGEVPQRDDVAAQVDWLSAQSEVLAARGEVDATRASLNVLLGQPPQAPLTLAVPPDPVPLPTLDAAMAQADQANADLKVLDRRIDEQNARVNLAKAMQKPDAGIGGGVTFDAEPEFGVGWRANFGITLPIFTTHKAGVLLENAELQRLHAEREAIARRHRRRRRGRALARGRRARAGHRIQPRHPAADPAGRSVRAGRVSVGPDRDRCR